MGQAQRRAGKAAQARGWVLHAAQSRRAIRADDSITSMIQPSVAKPGSRCGAQNTIWNLLALSKKHTLVIGGEVHRCGMPTIVDATSSGPPGGASDAPVLHL
jgi:hypothetical protein